MKKVFSFITKILIVIFWKVQSLLVDLAHAISDSFDKPKAFDASFGKIGFMERFNKGFVLAKGYRLTKRKSQENLMIIGATGTGKTSRLIIPNLLSLKNCSIILNDSSFQLFELFSGYLSQFFRIMTLNFSDSSLSSGVNIISIKKPNDVNKLSKLLISASETGNSGDNFWNLASQNFLNILLRILLHQPKEYHNILNILRLLKYFSATDKIDALVAKTGDENLILDYKTLIKTPEKTLQSIIMSTLASLQVFEDPEIAKVCSVNTINLSDIRSTPTILFLHNSSASIKYANILNGIFFEELYKDILDKIPKKEELDLYIILEEASSIIKYMPSFVTAIQNTRKHRVSHLVCLQSKKSLQSSFHEDGTIIYENCVTKVILPGLSSVDELRDLEQLSGKYTDESGKIVPLISADAIRQLPDDKILIISGNKKMIKGRTSPYYKSFKYRQYAKIPPISLKGDIPDGPIPLLPL